MNEQPSRPVVSVVTPVYNGERFLPDLLMSVAAQQDVDIEHVVVDDGSTDGTLSMLEDWRRSHPALLRIVSHENRGQYASMNDGLAAASGTLVLFICADDRLAFPDSLARAVVAWERGGMPDVIHGRWRVIDDSGQLRSGPVLTGHLPRTLALYVNLLSHCALLVRRDALATRGVCFDPELRTTGDLDFVLRLLSSGLSFRFTQAVIADYRIHPGQATRSGDQLKMLQEARSVRTRYGLDPRLSWIGNLLVRAARKPQAIQFRLMAAIRVARGGAGQSGGGLWG